VDEINDLEDTEKEIKEDIAAGIIPSNSTADNSTSILVRGNSTKILNPLIPGGETGFASVGEINSSAIAFLSLVCNCYF
jgi:hypothetical protein